MNQSRYKDLFSCYIIYFNSYVQMHNKTAICIHSEFLQFSLIIWLLCCSLIFNINSIHVCKLIVFVALMIAHDGKRYILARKLHGHAHFVNTSNKVNKIKNFGYERIQNTLCLQINVNKTHFGHFGFWHVQGCQLSCIERESLAWILHVSLSLSRQAYKISHITNIPPAKSCKTYKISHI